MEGINDLYCERKRNMLYFSKYHIIGIYWIAVVFTGNHGRGYEVNTDSQRSI